MAADPSYDPSEFQDVLRSWMARNGLSQMAAGHTLKISQGVINRWLKPRGDPYLVQPTVDSLKRIEPYLRVPLIQLKRMTNNLSMADLGLLNTVNATKPNNRLESLLADMRAAWDELEQENPQELQKNEDVTRLLWGLHHGRTRRPRKSDKAGEDGANSFGSLMRFGGLTTVTA